jgi:DNA-directed RNA polymerase specialized sigma24 family protein
MNSVALPASATGTTLGAEADLIRRAARGDGEAFEELYRRHGQVAWRFGQAVAADRDAAVQAVSEGFGRALRGLRRHSRMDTEGFRPYVLAAIYRAAVDNLHSHGAPAPAAPSSRGARGGSKSADGAFVEAAFRSLPERWRAAVWLSEVEAMSEDRIAPILGVSAPVAVQLVARARRGLVGRFEQGRRPLPAHLDASLRPLSATVPAGVGKAVGERWAALVNDPSARFAPMSAWLSERAVRPLWVSVGGLMGLSLIGLGIVGQNTGVNTGPVAGGALSGNVNAPGINPASPFGSHTFLPIASGAGLAGFGSLTPSGGAGFGGSGGYPGGNTSPGGFGSGGGGGGGNGSTPPGGGSPGLPITTPTLPITTPPTTPPSTNLLPPNPVISVTNTGSNYSATLLPTSSGGTASVSTCSSGGVGLTVGSTAVGCTTTSSSTGTLSTTTTTLGGL